MLFTEEVAWGPFDFAIVAALLFGAGLAQVLVSVIALMIWKPEIASTEAMLDVLKAVGVNVLFVGMWLGSGQMFQRANHAPNRQLD